MLEDALCLVFLEFQIADLAAKTAEDKTINALNKSWQKMTGADRAAALKLAYGEHEKALPERRSMVDQKPAPRRSICFILLKGVSPEWRLIKALKFAWSTVPSTVAMREFDKLD